MWFINPSFLRQSCLYPHCASDKQYIYGEIVTITESNGSCCIIFLFEKKQKSLITFRNKQRYAVYCRYCMLEARYGKNCEIYEYN